MELQQSVTDRSGGTLSLWNYVLWRAVHSCAVDSRDVPGVRWRDLKVRFALRQKLLAGCSIMCVVFARCCWLLCDALFYCARRKHQSQVGPRALRRRCATLSRPRDVSMMCAKKAFYFCQEWKWAIVGQKSWTSLEIAKNSRLTLCHVSFECLQLTTLYTNDSSMCAHTIDEKYIFSFCEISWMSVQMLLFAKLENYLDILTSHHFIWEEFAPKLHGLIFSEKGKVINI